MSWVKGQSGNPQGRPSGRTFVDLLRRELAKPTVEGSTVTKSEMVVARLVDLVQAGDVGALKLGIAYWQGLPKEHLELEMRREVERIAAEYELDSKELVDFVEARRRKAVTVPGIRSF